jgi:S-adenosylmethionine/arginine decarboxylase-like enzyme
MTSHFHEHRAHGSAAAPVALLSTEAVVARLKSCARHAKLGDVRVVVHEFEPQGASVALLGDGSALIVHTWPELGVLSMDVWSVRADAHALLEALLRWSSGVSVEPPLVHALGQ